MRKCFTYGIEENGMFPGGRVQNISNRPCISGIDEGVNVHKFALARVGVAAATPKQTKKEKNTILRDTKRSKQQ